LGITSPFAKIDIYDPWKNIWTIIENDSAAFTLPDFKRSVVVRVTSK
jgi:hypothetical protein